MGGQHRDPLRAWRRVPRRILTTLGWLLAVSAGLLTAAVGRAVALPGFPPSGAGRRLVVPRRRELLQLGTAGLTLAGQEAAIAEASPKFTSAWTAKDGVRFLTYFNEETYGVMRDDTKRTPAFIKAIQKRILDRKDKESVTVLDIGTGPFALFALAAARVGAKKVYAVEANPEAAARAKDVVAEQEDIPEGTVEVIEGFSTGLTLPEKVDLCVAEIIGAFASEENLIASIKDAQQRHVKNPTDPNTFIPYGVQTLAAPVSYALHPALAPPRYERLQGQPLRMNARDKTLQLLSDPQVLEDLKFNDPNLPKPGRYEHEPMTFDISSDRLEANEKSYYNILMKNDEKERPTPEQAADLSKNTANSISGVAFWPKLILDPAGEIVVESRGPRGEHQKSHWPTVVSLMTPTPVPVKAGDKFKFFESAEFAGDVMGPVKYTVDGELASGKAA